MSSMFASNALITGGTVTQVHGDAHYHGFREGANILYRETATNAFHNSYERFDPPKCHPNTRMAILEKIMKWIQWEEDLDAFIMWVYGPAGAGKSAIAQTIAEMCEEQMIMLASFFFSRRDRSRSSAKPLIATIAYQITLNLPGVRDAILEAIERDPLIFSKSLEVQCNSLIIAPLQPLAEAGFFKDPRSRHLVIIDGLDECSDCSVQRNIVDVLAKAQRQHHLPLKFLFTSRPEQHISLAFNTGLLANITTRIALGESYHPDKDIELFLNDKLQEIKSSHPLRAYIPRRWPLPQDLSVLVMKSSGQFIYASTVINYVSSIRHKPTDRLDIICGIRPPQRDLPFEELDALYTHILNGAENIEAALEIISLAFLSEDWYADDLSRSVPVIEEFLCLQPGDVELYLGDLNSLVKIESKERIFIQHASLPDFLLDPARSKALWINPRARHAAFARRCLKLLQRVDGIQTWCFAAYNITANIKNAEMSPELCDDLINFSLGTDRRHCHTIAFGTNFVAALKKLPLTEVDHSHIFQALQGTFDRILCNVLEKYHSFPGFALLLGVVHWYTKPKRKKCHVREELSSWYLVRYRSLREGAILNAIGYNGILKFDGGFCSKLTFKEILAYFADSLENPVRSGPQIFDKQRYATAAKECLQLCLCSHNTFSKGATEFFHRDKSLRRDKPWAWIRRSGVHSRIWIARHHSKVRLLKSTKRWYTIDPGCRYPEGSPIHEYLRSLPYRGALELLPSLLEKSAISFDLAEVMRRRTFTTMAQRFPRRTRLAKEAIKKYLSRVESAMGNL
ncbi:hypothetical protein M413DRAFT_30784 [Hebeloma cylindrosporum]|uniref:Nephrocystin 3-like N-terminal domain-containing protein n=1 Tax=Hebeloma cylindrosporum TaxID=76867 RepID=A0A0C2XIG5_HEBCY|nr:hypothetical protein M413DRAFT_30784 [Hebeloma cylindrosporum h7]